MAAARETQFAFLLEGAADFKIGVTERMANADQRLDRETGSYDTKMVGTAVTLKVEACEAGGSFLHEYAQALEFGKTTFAPVLVIESPEGCSGLVGSGIVYIMRRHYGFVGCVLDGLRDTDDLHNMKFQCYSRHVSPRYESGKLRGVSSNEPVSVGGVTILAGDIVVGDNDGVVAVPRDELPRIMAAMHEDFENELAILGYIDGGIPYLDAAKKLAAKLAEPGA